MSAIYKRLNSKAAAIILSTIFFLCLGNNAGANGYDDEITREHAIKQFQDWDSQQRSDAERRYNQAQLNVPEPKHYPWWVQLSESIVVIAGLFLLGGHFVQQSINKQRQEAQLNARKAQERKLAEQKAKEQAFREQVLMEQRIRDEIANEKKTKDEQK